MRRYYIALIATTLLLVLCTFILLWSRSEVYLPIMPFIALYFGVVTGAEHYLVVRSAEKDPRTFVKNFLGLTVGTLFLHLVVMSAYMFTHLMEAKRFVMAFCVGYIVYLVFETLSLVLFVKRRRG